MRKVHNLHVKNRPDIYKEDVYLTQEEFDKMMEKQEKCAIIAEKDKQVIGFGYAYIKSNVANPKMKNRKVIFVDDICVKETYQKQGVGTLILNEMKQYAKQKSAISMELMVWSFNNNAIEFYKNQNMKERSIVMEMKIE